MLEKLVAVEHFQPHEMDRVPRQGFDLYLNIDDGLRYRLPAELRPSAFWAIDTHLAFDRCREKAPRFDVVFAAHAMGLICFGGSAFLPPLGCLWGAILRFIASMSLPSSMKLPSSAMFFPGRAAICSG